MFLFASFVLALLRIPRQKGDDMDMALLIGWFIYLIMGLVLLCYGY